MLLTCSILVISLCSCATTPVEDTTPNFTAVRPLRPVLELTPLWILPLR